MKPSIKLVVLVAALCTTVAFAQDSSTEAGVQASVTTSPVAYIYVSSVLSQTSNHIYAYSAAPNGALAPVLGSPFPGNAEYMALNGKFLFANDPTDTYIYSFRIESNGALQQVSSIDAAKYNPLPSGGPGNLFLDHTGTTLYDGDIYAYGTGSNAYQFFTIDSYTGQLNYLGITADGGTDVEDVLSFIGNNVYAYSSSCYHFTPDIYGYKRNTNKTLSRLSMQPPIPAGPNGDTYCPYLAAADPTNHVVVSLAPYSNWAPAGQPQLAVYTATSTGSLTTTSTAANMPKTSVTSVNDMWMAPSGKLLAVAGTTGLEVFHFNGASPITHYTGLLTTKQVDQVWWDNANHLYALSRSAGKFYVFTVTPTSYSQAPGSPHTIASPQNVIVLPKT